jgi:hypothetical protein
VAALVGIAGGLLGNAGAAPPAPAKPAAPAPSTPARRVPVINLTATSAQARSAQLRLAAFIIAVQGGNWARARTYLSSRVTTAERQQLGGGTWLRPTSRNDPSTLVYMPQIEIRTAAFAGTTATMRVMPSAWVKTRGTAFGVWSVPMIKEAKGWMLDIHPDRKPVR